MAYDGTYITNASTTRLTSIHQPYKEIAQEAVRQLMEMIDGPEEEDDAEGQVESATADQIDSAKGEKHTYRRKSYTTSGERRKNGDTTL